MTQTRVAEVGVRGRRWGLWLSVWTGLVALTFGSLATLRSLPYSTSRIERVSEEEVLLTPGQVFKAGSLTWDLGLYRSAPELKPFRDSFEPQCSGKAGLDAARCVTDVIKASSPRGDPRVEFVDADFDPAKALRAHLEGAPGHCTTRSAMATTGLLSLGVPARIVQVLPLTTTGHNLLEVWDPTHGWMLFDPHFDSSYLLGDSFLSAVHLSQIHEGLRWRRSSDGQVDPNIYAGSTIHYPEPWLYTRVGDRCATWPFRGCFAEVGPSQFRYGPAQQLAFGSAVVFGSASGLWPLFLLIRGRRRTTR